MATFAVKQPYDPTRGLAPRLTDKQLERYVEDEGYATPDDDEARKAGGPRGGTARRRRDDVCSCSLLERENEGDARVRNAARTSPNGLRLSGGEPNAAEPRTRSAFPNNSRRRFGDAVGAPRRRRPGGANVSR